LGDSQTITFGFLEPPRSHIKPHARNVFQIDCHSKIFAALQPRPTYLNAGPWLSRFCLGVNSKTPNKLKTEVDLCEHLWHCARSREANDCAWFELGRKLVPPMHPCSHRTK
jgi:hypothetical protein